MQGRSGGGGANSRVWRAEGGEPRAESRESRVVYPSPLISDVCHGGVREARRGNPAGLLRRCAPRNDRL